jgi:hypothetical protein
MMRRRRHPARIVAPKGKNSILSVKGYRKGRVEDGLVRA